MQQAEKYDELTKDSSRSYKVAVLTTCTDLNAWCQAMTRYQAEAAEKYDVELDMYDAAFDPAKQLRQVQDAIAKGGYDGFIFAPVAAAPGCGMLEQLLDTGLPVQQVNSPVCESEDYSEGTTGMVSTSSEKYYRAYLEHVFDSCEGEPCKVAILGGVSGQDGWRRLQSANYDPNQALRITQDALQRDPDIEVILSAYDEMSRGVLQALGDAGKTPGEDVRIYSIGGTPYGLEQVAAGTLTATIQSDPYPEGYFGVVELVRFLETGVATEGWSSTSEWSGIVNGPGSDILTEDNVDKYEPTY
ncbi:sugar ABC transporter substrate-binding protein [Nocardioides sp.]|uniref:sugar ABC transporter substrate-binding protein n=1 Tax=Nocardioides sp. TaxID=35761 RepID=UPI0025FE6960|nr:sugar ABC transporter substrate-binding protein [Nocardioides sp.]